VTLPSNLVWLPGSFRQEWAGSSMALGRTQSEKEEKKVGGEKKINLTKSNPRNCSACRLSLPPPKIGANFFSRQKKIESPLRIAVQTIRT
jgi:hypothetical protein